MLILFIFRRVAILGFGKSFLVSDLITSEVSEPEILIIATPETPGPEDSAYIVINLLYPELFYWI